MTAEKKEKICTVIASALAECIALMESEHSGGERPCGEKLYTYGELAEIMGKSKDTIRQWIRAGDFGEPVQVGSSTRVTQEGLDFFIAEHRGQPGKRQTRPRGGKQAAGANPNLEKYKL